MEDKTLQTDKDVRYDGVRTSLEINEIAPALVLAQAEIGSAKKGNLNPHFKSKYADLSDVWDACREPLTKHGLSVVQIPQADGQKVNVTTLLLHKSGQFIQGNLQMTSRDPSPQAIGSCITYARRYSLSAFVSVAPDDDDGNEASKGSSRDGGARAPKPPVDRSQQLLAAFDKFMIGKDVLESHVGKPFDKFVDADFDKCGKLWGELKAGKILPDAIPPYVSPEKAKLEQVFQ